MEKNVSIEDLVFVTTNFLEEENVDKQEYPDILTNNKLKLLKPNVVVHWEQLGDLRITSSLLLECLLNVKYVLLGTISHKMSQITIFGQKQ